jgi:indole-3-glycerol phosphate synthase
MTYLDEILERKRAEVRAAAVGQDLLELHRRAVRCETDVVGALRRPSDAMLRIIAEHKRASPSLGPIRPGSDAAVIGRSYESAGAAAISVLTDTVGFGGTSADLEAVRAQVRIPVLCKDFIVAPIQVLWARSWGADLVLLIVAALSKAELSRLLKLTQELGMTALVEVHDAHELAVAGEVGATVIGVNNRNLHTFEVDLALSEQLAGRFPAGAVRVAESGIRTANDLRRLRDVGYDAALIGERFMSAAEPGAALAELLAEASA